MAGKFQVGDRVRPTSMYAQKMAQQCDLPVQTARSMRATVKECHPSGYYHFAWDREASRHGLELIAALGVAEVELVRGSLD